MTELFITNSMGDCELVFVAEGSARSGDCHHIDVALTRFWSVSWSCDGDSLIVVAKAAQGRGFYKVGVRESAGKISSLSAMSGAWVLQTVAACAAEPTRIALYVESVRCTALLRRYVAAVTRAISDQPRAAARKTGPLRQ